SPSPTCTRASPWTGFGSRWGRKRGDGCGWRCRWGRKWRTTAAARAVGLDGRLCDEEWGAYDGGRSALIGETSSVSPRPIPRRALPFTREGLPPFRNPLGHTRLYLDKGVC